MFVPREDYVCHFYDFLYEWLKDDPNAKLSDVVEYLSEFMQKRGLKVYED